MEALLLILVVALTCAGIGYGISRRASGALVGLLLGPPGVVVLYCVKGMIDKAMGVEEVSE